MPMSEIFYPPVGDAPMLPRPNVNNPSPLNIGVSEILPIVDENDIVKGRATRKYVHSGSMLLHPVVHLHLIDRFGRIYLQKRSMTRSLLPGYWDTAVGGHVGYGESILSALFREAGEEIGLYDFNPIPLDVYVYEGNGERELVHTFACIGSAEPTPDGDEVSEGRFWTRKEIEDCFGNRTLTPNFEQEYRRLGPAFEALL